VTPLADIPTLIVVGARGSGKTTLLARLLDGRPPGERVAVLLNERGRAVLSANEGVATAEIEPGCVCCTAQVSLRVALTRLLREARPRRLYIELAEGTHLRDALRTLRNPWLAPVLRLIGVLGVVDGRRVADDEAMAAWLADLTAVVLGSDASGATAALIASRRPGLRVIAADAPADAILSAAGS
jgi:G3E family GTPase